MHPVWSGAIAFGLVSIPVRLYAATEQRDVSFRQVHASDGGRIRYRRVCELDGEEVPPDRITRAYELPGGELVPLSEEELRNLPLSTSKTIDVVEFVPVEQIDPLLYGRAYYAEPDKSAAKPYVLMRDTLASAERVAVVKVALRRREALALLRARGDVLIVQTLLWPEEVRDPSALAPREEVTVRPQELKMASDYIETLTGDFDPDEFEDDYRAAVEELVASKTRGGGPDAEGRGRPARDENVVDLMDALRASVSQAKSMRSSRTGSARAGSSGGAASGGAGSGGAGSGGAGSAAGGRTRGAASGGRSASRAGAEKPARKSAERTPTRSRAKKNNDAATADEGSEKTPARKPARKTATKRGA